MVGEILLSINEMSSECEHNTEFVCGYSAEMP